MQGRDAVFSSDKTEWETPDNIFKPLDAEFGFVLDAAATEQNAKCDLYYTEEDDALQQPWVEYGPVWVNPPYGRDVGKWVKKAYDESRRGCLVVMLLAARTSNKWFHEYIYKKPGVEVRFIEGRVRFKDAPTGAPFPSMIVVFNIKKGS